jgi:plasmid stabilization system protein ParE
MTYRIEVSEAAEAEIDNAYLWLSKDSPERAARWHAGLLDAIDSLSEFPRRYRLVSRTARRGHEVRRLLYGRGRNVFRIVYAVIEPTHDDDDAVIRVLHVLHGAREWSGDEGEG